MGQGFHFVNADPSITDNYATRSMYRACIEGLLVSSLYRRIACIKLVSSLYPQRYELGNVELIKRISKIHFRCNEPRLERGQTKTSWDTASAHIRVVPLEVIAYGLNVG